MNKKLWIGGIIVLAVLLLSSPLTGYAAGPVTVDQHTAGQILTSETGSTWTCSFQPERAGADYYRGRAGQFERRVVRSDLSNRGRLECRALTGGDVKVFSGCQF